MSERDLDGRCGTCGWYKLIRTDESGRGFGDCRLGRAFPPVADSSTCSNHKPVGQSFAQSLKRKKIAGQPRSRSAGADWVEERPSIPREIDIDMDQDQFREALREVLLDELGVRDTQIGERWAGGEIELRPGKEGTQSKVIPLDVFFRKIVMVREKLRVLEQKVNQNKSLGADDKVQLQQYITAAYGSLTTFNVLFKDKEDQFTGQKSK